MYCFGFLCFKVYSNSDAKAMEGFGKDERIPVFLDKVACTGAETHLNRCTNAVPTGECSAVGVTCGKSSSELLTLGAHAQEGYGTCPVCLFVCLLPLNRRHRPFLRSN